MKKILQYIYMVITNRNCEIGRHLYRLLKYLPILKIKFN